MTEQEKTQEQTAQPVVQDAKPQLKMPSRTEKKVSKLMQSIKIYKQKLSETLKKTNKKSDPSVRSIRKKIKRLQRKVRQIKGLKLQAIHKKKGKTITKEKK